MVRNSSMDKENLFTSSMPPLNHITPPPTQLTPVTHPALLAIQPNPGQTTNGAKSSDGGSSDGAQVIVVEGSDEEESDDKERDKGEVTDSNDDAELGT
jgi:hypothetical protein